MKKILGVIVIVIVMTFSVSVLANKFYKSYKINISEEDKEASVKFKGLTSAKDFVEDDKGNFYIAFSNRIQFVNSIGKSYNIFKDNNLNIDNIEYYDGKIYYTSKNGIYYYNLQNRDQEEIINNLPNLGDYKDIGIKIYNGYLYASIGAATNSGVVGSDNAWIKDNPFYHDITPKSITLKGQNFGKNKTGAFEPSNTNSFKGQIVPEHFPGNASVIICNLKTKASETYAYGIRNISGMDFNSEGKLIADVGGMEDRGLRPIKGDSDYIYSIEKGKWYGWPDYSGGDPVDSPKFKGLNNTRVDFILDKHPTTNPPAPLYQHKSLSSLGALVVDSKGLLNEKDDIYFYDSKDNSIYFINNKNICTKLMDFSKNSHVRSMKFTNSGLIVLDSKEGYLISVANKGTMERKILHSYIIYVLIAVVLIGIIGVLLMGKVNKASKKK
ncbi:MAG: PQQ-dependent sugar dehydrogenase [Clostridium sp.]|uniref:PQQ-dependent sugar dehydrogenase n=1 Tax=Clostridium sp. TaxID=1506 RepID=UPI0039ED7270